MQGDITRSTFDPRKGYTSVRMQQGRLQLDADWNEQVDIQNHLRRAQVTDMIGAGSGASKVDPFTGQPSETNFQLQKITTHTIDPDKTPAATDIAIRSGHFYINGVLCELAPGSAFDVRKLDDTRLQIFPSLTVDGRRLQAGDWLILEDSADAELLTGWRISEIVDVSNREIKVVGDLGDIDNVPMQRILTYTSQPDWPIELNRADSNPIQETEGRYFAYLDVWQRHLTAVDDSTLREVALDVPDTTTRTKTVWQLKLLKTTEVNDDDIQVDPATFADLPPAWIAIEQAERLRSPQLTACARLCPVNTDTTNTGEIATNRRLGNFLYRVEIHAGTEIDNMDSTDRSSRPPVTFKWSRNNASIVSPVRSIEGSVIRISKSSQDAWTDSKPDQWLELLTEAQELRGEPGILVPLKSAFEDKLEFDAARIIGGAIPSTIAKVRRWDHTVVDAPQGAIPIQAEWVELENGIKVKFKIPNETRESPATNPQSSPDDSSADGETTNTSDKPQIIYRTGDYWLIPARTATNDIEWPSDRADEDVSNQADAPSSNPLPQPPQGIEHLYALLGIVDIDGNNQIEKITGQSIRFPSLLNALDRAGGTISGDLKIRGDLAVEGDFAIDTFEAESYAILLNPTTPEATLYGKMQASPASEPRQIQFVAEADTNFTFLSGNLGIGTDSPQHSLEINGAAKLQFGVAINEFSNDITLQDSSNTAIPTEQAVKTYVDTQIDTLNTIIDSKANFNGDANVDFSADLLSCASLDLGSTRIDEISTDGTLADDSNAAIPTEQAVKTYIDGQIGNLNTIIDSKASLNGDADRNFSADLLSCVSLNLGSTQIDEISTDGTLADDSNAAIPTEQAVKTYIDGQIGNLNTIIDSKANLNGDINENFQANEVEANLVSVQSLETRDIDSNDVLVRGSVTSPGYFQLCSQLLKDNVAELSGQEVAAMLSRLHPVKYKYKEDHNNQFCAGFIAEEMPDLLVTPDHQKVKLMDVIAVLTKAVQDNRKVIKQLAAKVSQQNNDIAKLKQALQTANLPDP